MEEIYTLEVRAYRDILPQLSIETPRCWFAADDEASHQHLLVLEDLHARGVRICRVQEPLNYDEAAGFVDLLARLHARWWNSDAFAPGAEFSDLARWETLPDLPGGAYQWGQLEPEVWDKLMQLPRGAAVPRVFHNRERMQKALLALQAFDAVGPNCLIHGDPHLGNLYITAEGAPGMLDWQSYRKGPWHHDLTYFLISSLDIGDRRRWEHALLTHYLERLHEHGVQSPPSFEETWDAYRRQVIDGLYFWLVNPVEFHSRLKCTTVQSRRASQLPHSTCRALSFFLTNKMPEAGNTRLITQITTQPYWR